MTDEQEEELVMTEVPVQESTIGDGDIIIFDIFEFCEATNSHAAMCIGNQLFVLQRDTLKWIDVRELGPKPAKLEAIKK